ncbi:MAG: hypothetical protein HeimAB125_19730 [Candidatus Heimdallarchaeota archaeon AB_125]|nr:MAG: hypothetical protein HeimAB125_19730 [Candidatus Heimdallarchaeota archaeon AB_125]
MKILKAFFLFLIAISLTMISIHTTNGMTPIEDISIDAVDISYGLQVSTNMNNSEYFLHVEGEVFEFSISVVSWGNSSPGPYNGLMVELVTDSTNSVHDSWIINHGDSSTHFFTSVTEINDIVRIRVNALYIEECIFDLTTSDAYPIWTYSLNVLLEQQLEFSVERFDIYYSSIEKLVLSLDSRYLDSDNYTLHLLDYAEYIVETETDNFALSDKSDMNLEVEEGVYEGEWYEVTFDFEGYDPSNEIILRMYYDHVQTENIVRLFLNRGNKDIHQIPIDSYHSNWLFLWTIEEEYTYIYPPPFNFKPLIYTIVCIGYLIGFFTVFGVYKHKKDRKSTEFELNKNKVEYSPNHSYSINFKSTEMNYDLVTKEAVTVACSICMQTISDKESIIRCPSCDIAFHKNHLYQWVVGNGTCPACKVRLKIQQH